MVMHDSVSPTSYWLDEDNRIEQVSGPTWDRFAAENRGDALLGERVLGRSLMDFIAGDTTRMWVHAVISYARLLGKAVSREYRCDSPDERRYMRMDIEPLGDGRLRVDHWLLRTESVPAPIDFQTATEAERAAFHRCSICNRVRIRGFWVEAHPAVFEHLGTEDATLPVVYAVCDDCQQALRPPPEDAADTRVGRG